MKCAQYTMIAHAFFITTSYVAARFTLLFACSS